MRLLLLAALGCAGGEPPVEAASPTAEPDAPEAAPAPPAPPAKPAEPTPGEADARTRAQCQAALDQELAANVRASAQDLNVAGMRCYRSDRLEAAVDLFAAAVDREPTHALAHYNLAATLGVLRGRSGPCPHDATVDRMMTHLEAAVQLDAGRRARLSEDPDLAPLHDVARFRILKGADPTTRRGVVMAVQGATFSAPPRGAFGPPLVVTLQGQAPHEELEHGALPARLEHRVFTDDGDLRVDERSGGWAVEAGGAVLLDPDGGAPGEEVLRYRLTPEGDLVGADGSRLLGTPDECSA